MDNLALDEVTYEHDELAELVDFEATAEEVLNRIEQCVSAFLQELSVGRLPSIQTVRLQKRWMTQQTTP